MKANVISIRLALLVGVVSAASGCSTAQVRMFPGENGNHKVVVRDIERDDSEGEALKAAQKFCEKQGKMAVYPKTASAAYTGSMDESTRSTIRKGSTAAMIVGGTGGVLGNGGVQTAGGILGTAGVVGRVMTNDKDYQTELEFKCQ